MSLEKRWSVEREQELLRTWESEGRFGTRIQEGRPVLVIDTPPPYMSGRPHIGQFASYAQMDMIVRFHRMRGFSVVFPFYADRNGLPVEVQVEKKYGIRLQEVPREKFLEMCRAVLNEYEDAWRSALRRWGVSADQWVNGTDSDEYRAMTQSTFIDMWRRGLIYEAERPTMWCPRCMTSLAEAEVEYRDGETTLNYVKFRVQETGEDIIIATTRPELIAAAVAVIYNPGDERYRGLEGRHAVAPIFGQVIPILPHPAAKPDFGSGLVMISTFGDTRDLAIVNELRLPMRIVVTQDGRMNESTGKYAGLPVAKDREEIIKDLEAGGLLVKRERIAHSVPVCWRCGTPIEVIVTRELFLKQLEFKDKLLALVKDRMRFHPPEYSQALVNWINSLQFDWPISRRRYYGTEIPIWYCMEGDGVKPILPSGGKYYRPWRDEAPPEVKEQCRGRLVGEDRILDTWFDSSISWMYASGYTKFPAVFKRAYPSGIIRPQGYEIIRSWLYYSVLRAFLLYGDAPFTRVRVNGMGLDEKGEAMHKSKGNVIDAMHPIEKYGADATRFWAAAAGKLGYDYRYQEQLLRTGRDFVTKVWNVARFAYSFPDPGDDYELTLLDEAIINELNRVKERIIKSYEELDVYVAAQELFGFLWHVFADHYVEAVKSRAYNREGGFPERQQRGAWHALRLVMDESLKLLAPIMPFVTDEVWRRVHGASIHDEGIGDAGKWSEDLSTLLTEFMRLNSAVWSFKNRNRISLAEGLSATIYAPPVLRPLERELREMHKVKISFDEKPSNAMRISDESEIYILMDGKQ